MLRIFTVEHKSKKLLKEFADEVEEIGTKEKYQKVAINYIIGEYE